MKAKIFKYLAYFTAFFVTLLPLTWSSYRLKTVSWPDAFIFAVILIEIWFYVSSFKKKTFKSRDLLLLIPLCAVLLTLYTFMSIFAGSSETLLHAETFLFFNLSTYYLLAGTISYFLWKQLSKPKQKKNENSLLLDVPIILFLLACVFSFINASDLERSLFMFKSILTGVIIFYFFKELFDAYKKIVKGLGYAYVFGASFTAILGLIQYLTGIPMGFIGNPGVHNFVGGNNEVYGRIASTMQHPNLLAAALLPAVFINLSLWLTKDKKKGGLIVGHLISIFVLVLAIVLTYSRAAWLGLVIGFAGVLLVSAWNNKKMLLGAAVAALVLLLLFHGQISERLKGTTGKDVNVVSRLEAWKSAVTMFKDFPFTGIGLNNYYVTYEKYKTPAAPFMMEDAHNTFLNTAAEQGLFGLVSLFLLLLVFFKKFFSKGKEIKVLVFGLLALLVAGCFENLWFDPRVIVVFWILLSTLYGTEKIYSKK